MISLPRTVRAACIVSTLGATFACKTSPEPVCMPQDPDRHESAAMTQPERQPDSLTEALAPPGGRVPEAGSGGCRIDIGFDSIEPPRPVDDQPSPWSDAARGIDDPELAAVATALWEHRMREYPVWSTRLGDARYHGFLTDLTPEAFERRDGELKALLARVDAAPSGELSQADRLTRELLREELTQAVDAREQGYRPETFEVDPLGGPQVTLLSLGDFQPMRTRDERRQMLERWNGIAAHLDQQVANLRRGLDAGRVASHAAVTTVIGQIEDALAVPVAEDPLLGGDRTWLGSEDDLVANLVLRWQWKIVEREVRPALERYRAFLVDEVLPAARSDEHAGLVHLAGGAAHYARLARVHTTLDLEPAAIHSIGLGEVAAIRARMEQLGREALGTSNFAELAERLRTDPALHYDSGEAIVADARAYLAKAEAAVPAVFGRLPRTPCEIHVIPAHEAPGSTTAYYMPPAADGSRVGRYYVNTHEPHTRPRYEAAALAYHEAVPGHHLQIALAQELTELPLFRRHAGFTAYVEGWALYTELLADELGLYANDLERLGMLSYQAWRACRLVVDTGLHAFGWSRDAAIEYMLDNTLLSRANVENEVDRYIAWPGQALAYMLGRIEIQRLRAEAEERLGERFGLAAFHDELLRHGPLPLEVLRGVIERWIGATAERGS